MAMIEVNLQGSVDASGDATITAKKSVTGYLYAVECIDGDLADGVDAVLSDTGRPSGIDLTLLTCTDENDDVVYYPRYVMQGEDTANLTATHGGDRAKALVIGLLELVISSGGVSTSGGAICYIEEVE